ncbi:MAG: Bax inhibitor-1/YccA family protein [Bacteroidetes bacterium]|nr:Bax inhibitor-1/YccA family protein [Bacteroidota bacterium]
MNTTSYNASEIKLAQSTFISKVYSWMSLALLITGAVAAYIASSDALMEIIVGNRGVFYGLLLGELALVWVISAAINRLSATTATGLFILYSVMNGLTLSVIFLRYTASSIGTTFFVTAGTFAVMSVYGHTTKRDLTSWGNLLLMALIGLIIASVVNLFWQNSMFYWICTYAGILIFVGLTAYDTQKIKEYGAQGFSDSDSMQKGALIGALQLYLDFINLFLYILRLLGNRRN